MDNYLYFKKVFRTFIAKGKTKAKTDSNKILFNLLYLVITFAIFIYLNSEEF